MQGERRDIRSWARQAMAGMYRWRAGALGLYGTVRTNAAGLLTAYRGWPSSALISGFLAFLAAAFTATFLLFPGARMRLREGVGRYAGLRRRERPIDRLRHWTRRATATLGLGR